MNKKLLFTLTVAFVAIFANAQNSTDMRKLSDRVDQVKAMKIGYLSERMSLTSVQSVSFWPVYNEYWKARFDLFEAKRLAQEKICTRTATKADIDELVRVEAEQAILMKNFALRFEKIISIDQTAKMFVAEEEFKSVLLKSLK